MFLFRQDAFPPAARAGDALAILASLVVFAGLLEKKRWAVPAEVARVAVLVIAGAAVALAG